MVQGQALGGGGRTEAAGTVLGEGRCSGTPLWTDEHRSLTPHRCPALCFDEDPERGLES